MMQTGALVLQDTSAPTLQLTLQMLCKPWLDRSFASTTPSRAARRASWRDHNLHFATKNVQERQHLPN